MTFEEWYSIFNSEFPDQIGMTPKEVARHAWMGATTLVGKPVPEVVMCSAQFIDMGINKINQIKICREHTAWGLKESKDWVESLPHTMTPKDGFSRQVLSAWVTQFKAAGGEAHMTRGNQCDRCELRFKCYTER